MTWRLAVAPFAAAIVAVATIGCGGEEPAEPPTPAAAAVQPTKTAAPSRPAATAPAAATPTPADTAVPTRAAAEPPPPAASAVTPTAIAGRVQPRLSVPGVDLHDSQVVTAPGRMRDTMAPWRDGGGNRFFSTHVFGTPFMLNEKGEVVPWIATAITSNEDMTVWTMKLREDAVFQDGTPITAADFKAYWEHGAKPENNVVWSGASETLGDIVGWEELLAGDLIEAEGLTVGDSHTLEIQTYRPTPAMPLRMAVWHVGMSKLKQVKEDDNWGNAPIGAGPFSLTYDPASGLAELTRVDLVGSHWNGPHDMPIIETLVLPNIEDEQARLLMFENGELDVIRIDTEIFAAALDLGPPFNPLLYESPYGGLWYIRLKTDMAPLEDLHVRKALAHGQDMESIVRAVWGRTATHAKGLTSSSIPCHDPDANHQPFDPDLARQQLAESTYGIGAELPPLKIDLSRPNMVAMGVAMKEYWKDNLGVELDVLKRESGMPRRETSQLFRFSVHSWIPDPIDIANILTHPSLFGSPYPEGQGRYMKWKYPLIYSLRGHLQSLPLAHPDRCTAFQQLEREYLEDGHMIPIREVDPIRWLVQPWLVGFKSTFNLDFNTLTTAYVARH